MVSLRGREAAMSAALGGGGTAVGGTAVGGTTTGAGVGVAAGPQALNTILRAATIVKRIVIRFIFFILLLEYRLDRTNGLKVYVYFTKSPPSRKASGKLLFL
jgi:hypothetical protein